MKIIHTHDISPTGVSHNPQILKKVFLARGDVPSLMMFGEATFQPGQAVESHVHSTMYEIFFILSGKALFIVNDVKSEVGEGDCVVIDQGEYHSQSNPYTTPVTWVYFGIATDGS